MDGRYIKTTDEEHQQIYKVDALSFLLSYYPERLVKEDRHKDPARSQYHLVEHDSLKFSNGKWFWFSKSVGGYTAFQFFTIVDGLDKITAHNRIALKLRGKNIQNIEYGAEQMEEDKQMVAPLPYCYGQKEWKITDKNVEKYLYRKNIYKYLCDERCIDKEIVDYFIDNKMLYEEKGNYHNLCFIGYKFLVDSNRSFVGDDKDTPAYCFKRGMNSNFKRDQRGSDKGFMFRYVASPDKPVHLFEAAIDMLSYMTLLKLKGHDWKSNSYFALGGVTRMKTKEKIESDESYAFTQILVALGVSQSPNMVLHFDNDEAGLNATKAFMAHEGKRFISNKGLGSLELHFIDQHVKHEGCKDVNDYLIRYVKHIKSTKGKVK